MVVQCPVPSKYTSVELSSSLLTLEQFGADTVFIGLPRYPAVASLAVTMLVELVNLLHLNKIS